MEISHFVEGVETKNGELVSSKTDLTISYDNKYKSFNFHTFDICEQSSFYTEDVEQIKVIIEKLQEMVKFHEEDK